MVTSFSFSFTREPNSARVVCQTMPFLRPHSSPSSPKTIPKSARHDFLIRVKTLRAAVRSCGSRAIS